MSREMILAIDQGTTNTKALLVDLGGAVVHEVSVPVPLEAPRPGWAETDADALWDTVLKAIGQCLQSVPTASIAAIAITNQRESAVAWDRASDRLLGPCISWQCRRSTGIADAVQDGPMAATVRQRTGLPVDPMFSASKMRWLMDANSDAEQAAQQGTLALGTVDSWLIWRLTAGATFATDVTNASRTSLLDIARLDWDEDLGSVFGVPLTALADVRPSSGPFGTTRSVPPLPDGVPILAAIGDSQAALFGHGAPGVGSVKATFGTGTSVMGPTVKSWGDDDLSTTVAWSIQGSTAEEVVYALEGNITATGAALEWLASIIGVSGRPEEVIRLADTVSDSAGVYLVPAFAGLGAPHWDARATGLITGLTRATTSAHIARATVDSIAYQVCDVLEAMAAITSERPRELLVDGGAMRSESVARTVANITGINVVRSATSDLSALGAAYIAGLRLGVWPTIEAIRALPRESDAFAPSPVRDVGERYQEWKDAVERTRSYPARQVIVA